MANDTLGSKAPQVTLQRQLSQKFRGARSRHLKARLAGMAAANGGKLNVIDLGGSAGYWKAIGFDWMVEQGIRVTCINFSESELVRNSSGHEVLQLQQGDACNVDAPDNAYDLVHSNSVIEHVGRWPDMVKFAREVRRLAPAYYVQTPYFWFPFDPHFYRLPFIHWLPASWRLKLLRRFKIGHGRAQPDPMLAMIMVESNVMLDRVQYRTLFPDGRHWFEMLGPLPKSMIVER